MNAFLREIDQELRLERRMTVDAYRQHVRPDGVVKKSHSLQEVQRQARGTDLFPYRCGFCGAWHVGHRSSRQRRARSIR